MRAYPLAGKQAANVGAGSVESQALSQRSEHLGQALDKAQYRLMSHNYSLSKGFLQGRLS